MARNTLHATEAAASIAISCPRDEGIAEVSALFAKIVLSLPYYNEAARCSEVSKYSPCRLEQMIAADVDSVQVATVNTRIVGFCFSNIDDVLSFEQRKAIVRGYASTAGFAKEQVNRGAVGKAA